MSLQTIRILSEIVQNLGIGLGAVLGGAGAFTVLSEWKQKRKHEREKAKWLGLFPVEKLGKEFKVMQSDEAKGVLFVHDLRSKTKHWIVNPPTLRALGLSYSDAVTIPEVKFRSMDRGDNVQIDA